MGGLPERRLWPSRRRRARKGGFVTRSDMTGSVDNTPQKQSPSYRLAALDPEFLLREEMRALRFQLEYAKADLMLRDWGVRSTIIVFGSARVPSPEQARAWIDSARTDEERAFAEKRAAQTPWYEAARQFARI